LLAVGSAKPEPNGCDHTTGNQPNGCDLVPIQRVHDDHQLRNGAKPSFGLHENNQFPATTIRLSAQAGG
jgi:hypothetical protein